MDHRRPYLTISVAFAVCKAALLAIVAGSRVGPTYDSSSALLVDHGLLTRLTSWDAIYFVKAAQRGGKLFEQEWAFGSALPDCISALARLLSLLGLPPPDNDGNAYLEALAGVILANTCHYLSALVLYHLGRRLVGMHPRWALAAALLHVLSPAGLFLSAPYAESPYALLSFTGWLLLVSSCRPGTPGWGADALTLLSAVAFGIATVFRTNGLLNGAPFAFEFLATVYRLVEDLDYAKTPTYLRRLTVLGLSGLLVAAGSVVPQFVAWRVYCTTPEANDTATALGLVTPSWCGNLVPSIYGHVQYKYWNNGFLLYWTLPNLPLFLLAGPMLFIMGKSGKDLFFQAPHLAAGRDPRRGHHPAPSPSSSKPKSSPDLPPDPTDVDSSRLTLILQSMVAAQVILVVMVFTRNHVQIITRLSSGYPAWYWWVAACLQSPKTRKMGGGIVVFMVMYACIQGVLFASFLPPA